MTVLQLFFGFWMFAAVVVANLAAVHQLNLGERATYSTTALFHLLLIAGVGVPIIIQLVL